MLVFSTPLVPNVILWWLTNISGRYFLAYTHGVAAVGLFGVATRFPALITMVTTVFAQAWQLSANRSAEDDEEERGRFYSQVFSFYSGVLILAVASAVLLLKPLMHVGVSPAFYDAWRAVPPLLIGAMFAALAAFYGGIYTAAHESRGIFRTTMAAGIGSLVLNAVLVPTLGVMGAALSIATCFTGLWGLRVVDSQRIVRTSVTPRRLIPGLLILLLQITVQYTALPAAVIYPLMMVAWFALLWLFRAEVVTAAKQARGALSRARA
jgi:O-antigen/teichoic acid export membrane protein